MLNYLTRNNANLATPIRGPPNHMHTVTPLPFLGVGRSRTIYLRKAVATASVLSRSIDSPPISIRNCDSAVGFQKRSALLSPAMSSTCGRASDNERLQLHG